MRIIYILMLVCTLGAVQANAQALRFRLAANSGMVFGEVGKELVNPNSEITEYPSATAFSPKLRLGADFEIMAPVSPSFDLGIEFEYSNLYGATETPKLYNYFLFDHVNPLPASYLYPNEPLFYKTSRLSILPAARYYLLHYENELNLFIRGFAGVSFIGTDLRFQDPFFGITYGAMPIYSIGTESNTEPKQITFTGGAGFGSEIELTELIALNVEASAAYTHSDILDGIPAYNYLPTHGIGFKRAEGIGTITGQISAGIIYTFVPDKRMNRSNYTKSKRTTGKKTWKPYKPKRKRR